MSRRFLWPVAHSCEPRFGPPSSAQFRLFGAKPPRQDPIGPHHHQPQYQKHPRKSQRVLHHARIPQRIRIHEPVWIESCDCAADQRRCRVDRGIRHPPHRVLPSQPALLHKQQPPPHTAPDSRSAATHSPLAVLPQSPRIHAAGSGTPSPPPRYTSRPPIQNSPSAHVVEPTQKHPPSVPPLPAGLSSR